MPACECGCGGVANKRYIKGHNDVHAARRPIVPYREEDHGYETLCWVWLRARIAAGYGAVWADGKVRRAHIVYYERHVGPVPAGLELDHLCRVRACVNPNHLEPVTGRENTRRGVRVRLTPDDVRAIRTSTESQQILSRRYGITPQAIGRAQNRVTWKDVA